MLPALTPRAGDQPGEQSGGGAGQLVTFTALTTSPSTNTPRTTSPLEASSSTGVVVQSQGQPRARGTRPHRRHSESVATTLAPPSVTLEDFELHFKLGEGGGGTVWQCTKRDTGQIFAIKIVEKSSIVS